MLELFIKSINTDDAGRIIVVIQDHLAEYMAKDDSKKMIKDMVVQALGENFVKLEMSKTSARITVAEGTTDACKTLIEEELKKGLELAMSMMGQMQDDGSKTE
jgi:hypothetical protein